MLDPGHLRVLCVAPTDSQSANASDTSRKAVRGSGSPGARPRHMHGRAGPRATAAHGSAARARSRATTATGDMGGAGVGGVAGGAGGAAAP